MGQAGLKKNAYKTNCCGTGAAVFLAMQVTKRKATCFIQVCSDNFQKQAKLAKAMLLKMSLKVKFLQDLKTHCIASKSVLCLACCSLCVTCNCK